MPLATGVTSVSYSDTTASNGTRYYYTVAAAGIAGTGVQSAEASATPEPPPPAAPTGVTATAGNAAVTLNWTASSRRHFVQRLPRHRRRRRERDTTRHRHHLHLLSRHDRDQRHEVLLQGCCSQRRGNRRTVRRSLGDAGASPACRAYRSDGDGGHRFRDPELDRPSGAVSYNVYRGITAGGESGTAIVTGLTAASYSDTTVTNGTKYYYKVAASNTAGTGAQSAEASATPEPPAPAAPTGLTATAGNASVTLNWTASSGATSYNVYRGTTAGGESATPLATGITAVSYPDTAATNGTKYYYTVAAVNGGGTVRNPPKLRLLRSLRHRARPPV